MMNQNPAKYMKTARVSRPPDRLDLAPGLYRLHLDDYVRDGAEVYDGEQRIPDVEIRKLCMKKGEKYANVYVPEQVITAFESADWKRLTLRTDMRFLIERMRDFYSKHTLLFDPSPPDPAPDGAFSLEHPLSEQQRQAVVAALSTPVTYTVAVPAFYETIANGIDSFKNSPAVVPMLGELACNYLRSENYAPDLETVLSVVIHFTSKTISKRKYREQNASFCSLCLLLFYLLGLPPNTSSHQMWIMCRDWHRDASIPSRKDYGS